MEFFNEFSLNSFIKQIKTYTSENIKSIDDLNGCSILIKNVVDSNDLQQKNFLNFLETDLSILSSSKIKFSKPRIFSTAKKNIINEIDKGLFREDLFYRLNVVPIKIPSLKDRFEDISDLTSFFLKKHSVKKQTNRIISFEGINLLKEYLWPGNIRELQNVIERLCLVSSVQEISTDLIKEVLLEDRETSEYQGNENLELFFKNYLKKYFKDFDEYSRINNLHSNFISKIEKPLIECTLNLFRGNQLKASKFLGFNRNTLRSKISLYGIEVIKKRKI